MCISSTSSQTCHSHSSTQTWQQPNKRSPPPTGASHLLLQHPALFTCPFLLGLPEVLMLASALNQAQASLVCLKKTCIS